VIAQAFVAGAATLVVVVALYRRWLAALPRTVCPSCGEATTGVSHPLWAHLEKWVRRRWCAACGWEGWGRNGPMLSPGRLISHQSGFRWGPERLEADFGFRFRASLDAVVDPAATRAHPSGFRWAGTSEMVTDATGPAAHPAGFRFRSTAEDPGLGTAHPSGFRWAGARDRVPGAPPSFRWRG
jgi:hypothetical protein